MSSRGYRKLGRTADQRRAMLRQQVTALLYNGKLVTTEARAREISKIAEGMIALAVREKDNFDEVTVTCKVPRKDATGARIKTTVDGKKVCEYDEIEKTIKKDQPSRLAARRKMLSYLFPITEKPEGVAGRKAKSVKVDMPAKLFDEIAPKYANRNGGYTRIVKIGPRKGDAAMQVLIELV